MKNFFIKYNWIITVIITLFLLVAHLFSWENIVVDNTTIFLLIVIFLSPLATEIRKIKFGDFEAEIDSKEIKQIQENILLHTNLPNDYQNLPRIEKIINQINKLSESDSVLSLAKLRIEIEKILNDIYNIISKDKNNKVLNINQLLNEIHKENIISANVFHSTKEVISVCNKAIHGIEIKKDDVEIILESGYNLLWQLASVTGDDEYILDPVETIIITRDIVDDYEKSQYQVTTITPLVNNPTKNIRILNQSELDDLLEGYHEYAEFIIDIRKIK